MADSTLVWRVAAAALLGLPMLVTPLVSSAYELSTKDRELLSTRTPMPEVSDELAQALELQNATSDPADSPRVRVDIGEAARRQSTEAALAALDALDPQIPQHDLDRAWVASQRIAALAALGRGDEVWRAAEQFRQMPRTQWQDREVLFILHALDDTEGIAQCEMEGYDRSFFDSQPVYPEVARMLGIEGWVLAFFDVDAQGRVEHVGVLASSMRVFEAPVTKWLLGRRIIAPGKPAGYRCSGLQRLTFKLAGVRGGYRFSVDSIPKDAVFTYRAIGAARRIRDAARQAVLDGGSVDRP